MIRFHYFYFELNSKRGSWNYISFLNLRSLLFHKASWINLRVIFKICYQTKETNFLSFIASFLESWISKILFFQLKNENSPFASRDENKLKYLNMY